MKGISPSIAWMQFLDYTRIFHLIILGAGLIIVYFGFKGYLRTGNSSLLFLAIGFSFVALGSSLAGLYFEIWNYDILTADAIEAGLAALGFSFIVYSLVRRT